MTDKIRHKHIVIADINLGEGYASLTERVQAYFAQFDAYTATECKAKMPADGRFSYEEARTLVGGGRIDRFQERFAEKFPELDVDFIRGEVRFRSDVRLAVAPASDDTAVESDTAGADEDAESLGAFLIRSGVRGLFEGVGNCEETNADDCGPDKNGALEDFLVAVNEADPEMTDVMAVLEMRDFVQSRPDKNQALQDMHDGIMDFLNSPEGRAVVNEDLGEDFEIVDEVLTDSMGIDDGPTQYFDRMYLFLYHYTWRKGGKEFVLGSGEAEDTGE